MIKVTKTAQSITLANGSSKLSIVKQGANIVFIQQMDNKDTQAGLQIQMELNRILKGYDSKSNFQKRFSKLATIVTSIQGATSFAGLKTKLLAQSV